MNAVDAAKLVASRDPYAYSFKGNRIGALICEGIPSCKECFVCEVPYDSTIVVQNALDYLYEHDREAYKEAVKKMEAVK